MEWISVDDRLPEIDTYVLCQRTQTSMDGTKYITPMVGKVNKQGRFSCAFDWVNVTHWMPLPDAPESDKDKAKRTVGNYKPLSELTEKDAIEIAEASVNDTIVKDWITKTNTKNHVALTSKDGKGKITFAISKNMFTISFYGVYFDNVEILLYNTAKATDKARELGYDI